MTRKTIAQKIAAKELELNQLKQEAARQNKKDDTRRKILIGAATMSYFKMLSDEKRPRAWAAVYEHVTKPADRKFLGLKPLQLPDELQQERDSAGS
ncbi:hypothetical protein [Pseudaestuariivita rosea]|uniref:hypothetical protein n=1 Tax=Pseudaestuariivita rosea TaxID=2763263 RepID=UPI001ABB04B1|nr:hypothetical protein [Pseudaestuariivita rosea]